MTIPAESDSQHPWYSLETGKISRITFNGSPGPTLGIEVEYQIIDPESGELAPGGPQILEAFNQPAYAKEELLQSTVELDVGPCKDVGETRDALSKSTSTSGAAAVRRRSPSPTL
ncbi:MAG: hypothetical protein IH849_14895 [Acidobacteria bacterium]|nr:hypothetical protein [Acidobacteriota bacterium]